MRYYHSDGYWRLRFLSRLILIHDRNMHPPLFSVRSGCVKEYRIGKYGIQFLKVFKYE